jgi:hypothetical protein
MSADDRPTRARQLERDADRCDELAEVAELMGDDATATALRSDAHRHRMRALQLLDAPGDR